VTKSQAASSVDQQHTERGTRVGWAHRARVSLGERTWGKYLDLRARKERLDLDTLKANLQA
jgi:hypothetical protein